MATEAIRFDKICKKYVEAEKYAVDHVSLTVEDGDFVTILGTSGSGKTTLLKMTNRLIEPTDGKLYFYGEEANNLPVNDYRRKIGYVIQQSGLFPHMTVEENISAVPNLLKWDKAKTAARVEELMTLIGLDPADYRKRYPRQLSGGEQQRVGLARAMASDPSVMLMDEPFGAIDAITRAGLQDQLKNLQRNLHKTIMFVTHDIQEAFKLGNKVIIMDKGQVQQYDTPYNILFNPANDYVRRLTQSNSMYDKLCLVSVESVMDRAVPRTDAVIGLGANLGEALTYMVKNQTNDCKVMGGDGVAVGGLSLDKIWDVVRPAL